MTKTSHLLDLPSYYAPEDAGSIYLERVGLVSAEAAKISRNTTLQASSTDQLRVAVFAIDCQASFCHPQGSLFVPGAVEDMGRALGWLYRNLGQITTLVLSQDAHLAFQIFHPAWWRDASGAPPAPFTPITADDVRSGRWIPNRAPEASLEYVTQLDVTQRYTLTIWPYHGLLGSVGQALMPALNEAVLLHSLARQTDPVFVSKGSHPLTESYSVLSPEVTRVGGEQVGAFDEVLYQTLLAHDRIYVFGQASSHCVAATLSDLLLRMPEQDPSLARRIHILEDAMSPVSPPPLDPLPEALDFPLAARRALARFEAAGMTVCRTDAPIGS